MRRWSLFACTCIETTTSKHHRTGRSLSATSLFLSLWKDWPSNNEYDTYLRWTENHRGNLQVVVYISSHLSTPTLNGRCRACSKVAGPQKKRRGCRVGSTGLLSIESWCFDWRASLLSVCARLQSLASSSNVACFTSLAITHIVRLRWN